VFEQADPICQRDRAGRPPLVSVVIPAFDRPEYLRLAIRSVLDQSFGDLELIVSDDAGPRCLAPTVEAFGDPRVRYLRNDTTLGVNANIKVGIAQALGRYLVVLNDDDLWGPAFLERMVACLEGDATLVVAFCNFQIIDAHGDVDVVATQVATRHFGRDTLVPGRHHPIVRMTLVDGNIPAVMCALFRRDAIDWASMPEGAGSSYDLWMAYMAAMTSMAAYYEPAYLTYYRTHPGQQTRTRTLAHFSGRVYCYEQFVADPQLIDLRRWLRPMLASEYAGYGTLLLRMGEREAARAKLAQSLALSVTLRSLTGYTLSLLPTPLAAKLALLVTTVKSSAQKGLRWIFRRPLLPRRPPRKAVS
jgi:glycosyltransferase involved in cell wall biosynthesis